MAGKALLLISVTFEQLNPVRGKGLINGKQKQQARWQEVSWAAPQVTRGLKGPLFPHALVIPQRSWSESELSWEIKSNAETSVSNEALGSSGQQARMGWAGKT